MNLNPCEHLVCSQGFRFSDRLKQTAPQTLRRFFKYFKYIVIKKVLSVKKSGLDLSLSDNIINNEFSFAFCVVFRKISVEFSSFLCYTAIKF